MLAQALPVAFWVLIGLALVGIALDVRLLRAEQARTLGVAAVALKAAVLVAFLGWWAYFKLLDVPFQGFVDLATFVSIMLLSIPAFAAALVCEALGWRKLRRAE